MLAALSPSEVFHLQWKNQLVLSVDLVPLKSKGPKLSRSQHNSPPHHVSLTMSATFGSSAAQLYRQALAGRLMFSPDELEDNFNLRCPENIDDGSPLDPPSQLVLSEESIFTLAYWRIHFAASQYTPFYETFASNLLASDIAFMASGASRSSDWAHCARNMFHGLWYRFREGLRSAEDAPRKVRQRLRKWILTTLMDMVSAILKYPSSKFIKQFHFRLRILTVHLELQRWLYSAMGSFLIPLQTVRHPSLPTYTSLATFFRN